MSDNLTAVLIVAISVLGPVWIVFHFIGKGKAARQLNARDAAAFDQLAATAARMEGRMAILERILDAEVPDWRRTNNLGGQYDRTMG
jgi:phage shock protein B